VYRSIKEGNKSISPWAGAAEGERGDAEAAGCRSVAGAAVSGTARVRGEGTVERLWGPAEGPVGGRRRGGGWPDGWRRVAGRAARVRGEGMVESCGERRRVSLWPEEGWRVAGRAAAPGQMDARHERGAGLHVVVWELQERRVRERRKERESKCFLVTSGSGG
jgi:hypothetical protein